MIREGFPMQFHFWRTILLALLTIVVPAFSMAQLPSPPDKVGRETSPAKTDEIAAQHEGGYILLAPLGSNDVNVMDRQGKTKFQWPGERRPGNSVYLLDDGSLLKTGSLGRRGPHGFDAGGAGGVVEKISISGEVVWRLDWVSEKHLQHHDIEPLPNGNLLLIAWERKTREECLAIGRHESLLPEGELWVDAILEIKPTGNSGGEVVWRWSAWDHLVQDLDPKKPNHGSPSKYPEKADINHVSLRSRLLGKADWMHTNSVDYNAELDQIILSVHGFDEVWIIDHSTSGAENPGILWRWGNPQAYCHGSDADQELFKQHDAQWIQKGRPGEDNILIFNNGQGRAGNYSTVLEIKSPLEKDGTYRRQASGAFEEAQQIWKYGERGQFFSPNISGAERLPGGNTLICSGANGTIFEVTPEGEQGWKHSNEIGGGPDGAGRRGGGGRGGALFRAPWIPPTHAILKEMKSKEKKPETETPQKGTAL